MSIRLSRWLLTMAVAGLATGCAPVRHNLPPADRLMEPGPGVGGPGPGILEPPGVAMGGPGMGGPGMGGPGMGGPEMGPGSIAPVGYNCGDPNGGMMMPGNMATVQMAFTQPESMELRYDATGSGRFDSDPLIVPAMQNFGQGGLYRLKLTNIVGREGVELYPTIEIAVATPRTGAYLAHNAIPIQFTADDLDQVQTGNFVTKVIFLPDPEFQGPAIAGIDTVVSTRLDPGLDPIVEADRRGTIMAILRLGNKDIELGNEGAYASSSMGAMGGPYAMGPCMTEGCAGSCGMGPGGSLGPSGGAMMAPGLPGQISGVTTPQYGMPISGTPIGLPGPPHVPLGIQAGLKKHVIRNYTNNYIPKPVDNVHIGVRQQPGFSYPTPPSRVNITEQNIHPGVPYARPEYENRSRPVSGTGSGVGMMNGGGAGGDAYCPPGN